MRKMPYVDAVHQVNPKPVASDDNLLDSNRSKNSNNLALENQANLPNGESGASRHEGKQEQHLLKMPEERGA